MAEWSKAADLSPRRHKVPRQQTSATGNRKIAVLMTWKLLLTTLQVREFKPHCLHLSFFFFCFGGILFDAILLRLLGLML